MGKPTYCNPAIYLYCYIYNPLEVEDKEELIAK